jgi:hypothetical protein
MSESESVKERCAKRFLAPSQKYEIWLRLVRREVPVARAAPPYRAGVIRAGVIRGGIGRQYAVRRSTRGPTLPDGRNGVPSAR